MKSRTSARHSVCLREAYNALLAAVREEVAGDGYANAVSSSSSRLMRTLVEGDGLVNRNAMLHGINAQRLRRTRLQDAWQQ